jgi:hypothetical protein
LGLAKVIFCCYAAIVVGQQFKFYIQVTIAIYADVPASRALRFAKVALSDKLAGR